MILGDQKELLVGSFEWKILHSPYVDVSGGMSLTLRSQCELLSTCAQTQSSPRVALPMTPQGPSLPLPPERNWTRELSGLGLGAPEAKNFLKLSLLSVAKGFSHLPTHHLPVSHAEGGASNSWGRWRPYSKTSSALTLSPEDQASLPLILEVSVMALTSRRGWK